MRQVIGFLALHAALIGVGFSALRALGLVQREGRAGWRWLSALGPALLIGIALVVPCLIVALVLGLELTLGLVAVVMVAWVLVSVAVGARSRTAAPAGATGGTTSNEAAGHAWWRRALVIGAGVYAVLGALALSRAPTGGDDARIWSLRGLTITYYGRLQPEIFLNPLQSGAHPVYPLFAPVTEAVLSKAMGRPELRIYHTELWLLCGAAVWTAGFLLLRHVSWEGGRARLAAITPLAALAVVPIVVSNVIIGYVDVAGSVLLAVGALAFGLWIEAREGRYLAVAAILLAAAASTKDEDLLAAGCVIVLGFLATLLGDRSQRTRQRLIPLLGVVAYFVLVVAPWRLWTAKHHLSDGVEPPLPHALDPSFLLHRTHQLKESAAAMLTQVLQEWRLIGSVFVVACVACLMTRTVRRIVAFYLGSVAVIVVALLWLYTTTPASLSFLLPTSMNRTVGVFMTLALVATAHLLAQLAGVRTDSAGPAED